MGSPSCRIRKIAPVTASAERKRLATTVRIGGANTPKLRNTRNSQKISTDRNGVGTVVSGFSDNSERSA